MPFTFAAAVTLPWDLGQYEKRKSNRYAAGTSECMNWYSQGEEGYDGAIWHSYAAGFQICRNLLTNNEWHSLCKVCSLGTDLRKVGMQAPITFRCDCDLVSMLLWTGESSIAVKECKFGCCCATFILSLRFMEVILLLLAREVKEASFILYLGVVVK